MGKKFLTVDQQEEVGILSPEVRARLAQSYNALEGKPMEETAMVEAQAPGQTALFNNWEDAVECAPVRWADGSDRLLLHVSGLRD